MLVTKKYIDGLFSDILAEWLDSPVVREEVRVKAWEEYGQPVAPRGWPPPIKRPSRYVRKHLLEILDPMREQMYTLAQNANAVLASLDKETDL